MSCFRCLRTLPALAVLLMLTNVTARAEEIKTVFVIEIFHAGPLLGDAINANDLSDLFQPGAVPKKP